MLEVTANSKSKLCPFVLALSRSPVPPPLFPNKTCTMFHICVAGMLSKLLRPLSFLLAHATAPTERERHTHTTETHTQHTSMRARSHAHTHTHMHTHFLSLTHTYIVGQVMGWGTRLLSMTLALAAASSIYAAITATSGLMCIVRVCVAAAALASVLWVERSRYEVVWVVLSIGVCRVGWRQGRGWSSAPKLGVTYGT